MFVCVRADSVVFCFQHGFFCTANWNEEFFGEKPRRPSFEKHQQHGGEKEFGTLQLRYSRYISLTIHKKNLLNRVDYKVLIETLFLWFLPHF